MESAFGKWRLWQIKLMKRVFFTIRLIKFAELIIQSFDSKKHCSNTLVIHINWYENKEKGICSILSLKYSAPLLITLSWC